MNPAASLFGAAAILAAGAAALRAQAATGWSVTATPAWVSQYMFRGQRLGAGALQPSVEADDGGLALGVWTSFPTGATVREPAYLSRPLSDPEIDLYGSYAAPLSSSVSLQPGLTWYTYPDADSPGSTGLGNFRSTFEPNLALNWTVGAVRLAPKLYYDVVLRSLTGELNAAAALPLRSIGSEVDLGATLGGYDERNALDTRGASLGPPQSGVPPPDVRRTGGYWLVQASLPYQLGVHARASLSYAYTSGFDTAQFAGGVAQGPNPLAAGRGVVTLSLAYRF